jgi:hypothetical protein
MPSVINRAPNDVSPTLISVYRTNIDLISFRTRRFRDFLLTLHVCKATFLSEQNER